MDLLSKIHVLIEQITQIKLEFRKAKQKCFN